MQQAVTTGAHAASRSRGNFGDAVNSCLKCDGLIIDLRGNPGGIGGMAMGLAGFLVDKQDQKLGTMYMREAQLKFGMPADSWPTAELLDRLRRR